jgi:hypothetical protein
MGGCRSGGREIHHASNGHTVKLKDKPLKLPKKLPPAQNTGKRRMTPSMLAFAEHYAQHANATEAVLAHFGGRYTRASAGTRGSAMLKHPLIAAKIAEIRAKATEIAVAATAIDKEWVLGNLKSIIERSMQTEPVLDKKGVPTGEYQFNAAGANRALELVGKELGMFVDRKEVRTGPLEELSEDDLTAIIVELAAQNGLALGAKGSGTSPVEKPATDVPAIH